MWDSFGLIAGPCLLEDDDLNLRVAEAVARVGADHGIPVVFKASFDKANRSKGDSARGPGLDEGLERLRRVKEATGLPVLTDIHEPAQAGAAGQVVDILQIPAFLSRQTDLLLAAGATGLPVNVKRGQWMAPEDLAGAVGKVRDGGSGEVLVTERGTFFGYGDLVVDMRVFPRIRAACAVPVIFDGTHSVQQPGRADGSSGGTPEFTETLVRAAVAAGCDGLFLEVHPEPATAPSDGSNMLQLDKLSDLIGSTMRIRAALDAEQGRAPWVTTT